jgi:hypothetical protein
MTEREKQELLRALDRLYKSLAEGLEFVNEHARARLYRAISAEDIDELRRWVIVDGVAYERSLGIPLDIDLMRPPWEALH